MYHDQDCRLRSVQLGDRLRQARLNAPRPPMLAGRAGPGPHGMGLRQSEVARLLGVDPAMPSRWEGINKEGEKVTRPLPVPGSRLPVLAAILSTTIEELAPEAIEPRSVGVQTAVIQEATGVPTGEPASDLDDGASYDSLETYEVDVDGEDTCMGIGQMHMLIYSTNAGSDGPSPVPGRPSGQWRIRCWQCGHMVDVGGTYTLGGRPLCDWCGVAVRAAVTLTRLE